MKICRKGLHQFSGKQCGECIKITNKAWKEANSEQEKANTKAWKEANKDKIKAWYEANKEVCNAKKKAWREANKDKIKAWYEANKEVCNAKKKAWKEVNKEREKANQKAYQKANQDKCNAHSAKRRSKKLNATPTWLTKEHFNEIGEFYKESQQLTKETGIPYQVDHIVPLQGETVSGLHVPWNLRVVTAEENIKKSNKLIEV